MASAHVSHPFVQAPAADVSTYTQIQACALFSAFADCLHLCVLGYKFDSSGGVV